VTTDAVALSDCGGWAKLCTDRFEGVVHVVDQVGGEDLNVRKIAHRALLLLQAGAPQGQHRPAVRPPRGNASPPLSELSWISADVATWLASVLVPMCAGY
jgi:hypothetical protein